MIAVWGFRVPKHKYLAQQHAENHYFTLISKKEFSLVLDLRNSALNTHTGLIQCESVCLFTLGSLHSQAFTSLQFNKDILKYYVKVLFKMLCKPTSSESTNMQHITVQSVLSPLFSPAPPN